MYQISLAVKDGHVVVTGESGELPSEAAWMITGFQGSESGTLGVTISTGSAAKGHGNGTRPLERHEEAQ